MRGNRLYLSLTVATILLLVAGARLAAQDPGAPGQYDAERGREGEQKRHAPMITDDELEGPPYPQFVVVRFELDSTEANSYRQIYDSFMVASKPLRDSTRAARGKKPSITDPAAYVSDRDRLERLSSALKKQENQFDKRVKSVFTSAHYKDYKQWKDEQRKQAEEQEMQSRPREPSD